MMRDDGTPFREVEDSLWSASRRLADCDRARVRAHVLSTVPVLFSYWAPTDAAVDFSRLLNDHMIESVKAAPDRFVGLGTLPMQSPRHAVDELRRCVAGGLAGVQIGSHVNNLPLSDASFFPVFEAAAELGAAVFVHPWDMMGAELMKDYWLSWLVGMPAETTLAMCSLMMGGVLERLPALRVCFAHGGGSFAATLGRIEHGWAVRPDLCQVAARASPAALCAARRVWVDSLVHEPRALDTIVRTFGAERVCLGTDYPFPLGEFTAESGGTEYDAGALIDSMAGGGGVVSQWGDGWAPGGSIRDNLLSGAALSWLGPSATAPLRAS
jgi:aminocarboxymuconate-semialdehyde decarboxylase